MEFEELRKLIASADDNAGDHCLWMDTDGNVHMDMLPCEFKNLKKKIRQYKKGEGWCGPEMAKHDLYVNTVYTHII